MHSVVSIKVSSIVGNPVMLDGYTLSRIFQFKNKVLVSIKFLF